MAKLPTLHKELTGGAALIIAAAIALAVAGTLLASGRMAAGSTFASVTLVSLVILGLAMALVSRLLRRRLLQPLDQMIDGAETISRGDIAARLPEGGTLETARLAAAVNQMAERLIHEQQVLAANIQSLNETNRMLTEARDAMIRAEKMASVGRLGAGIAHEVGNPLGAILGYLGLVARHVEGQDRDLLESAEREARRIDRIVRGLLDFARPRETVAQTVDVNRVISDTLELVRTQGHFNGVDLRASLTADDVVITGDPYQLQQVFVNLFVNAADALADVREPHIAIQSVRRVVEPAPAVQPARRKEDPAGVDYSHRRRLAETPRYPAGDPPSASGYVVEVSVTDNGTGIPKDLLDKVFEPFVTSKEPGKGTGLGLAVCARIVESMGGVIHAGNAPDAGARFRIILPAIAAEE